jgi:predicted nucleotidyltransferase
MTSQNLLIASELKNRLSHMTSIIAFKVFGSRARDDADKYSDLDVFIVVEALDGALKDHIAEIVWEVGFENYLVISPLIVSRDELENTPLRSSPIIQRISEEGISV